VIGLSSGASAIGAGYGHTCALMTSGAIECWGHNGYGQLGDGSTTNRYTPVDVSGHASGASALIVGYDYNCTITVGAAKCWGRTYNGFSGIIMDSFSEITPQFVRSP
jgi:hypothetical protein